MPGVNDTLSFREVPGFCRYRITNSGYLQAKKYKNVDGRRVYTGEWIDVKAGYNDAGYLASRMERDDGKRQYMRLHRVVLMAWVGPCPEGKEACHIDGSRTNNHVDNLYWGTSQENKDDEIRIGGHAHGERHGMSKLTEADIREIRYLYANGWLQREIAVKFGMTRAGISFITTGRLWKHVAV
jgi:hypothetical protein